MWSGVRTNDACRAVADLVVLALGELYEEFCDLMLDLHLTEDCRAIVCDGDVAIWRDEDFVETCDLDVMLIACTHEGEHTAWSKGCADDVCDCSRGEDVGLDGYA